MNFIVIKIDRFYSIVVLGWLNCNQIKLLFTCHLEILYGDKKVLILLSHKFVDMIVVTYVQCYSKKIIAMTGKLENITRRYFIL